jgi:hypothetical protein
MTRGTSLFVAYGNPKPGREDEYDQFYSGIHIPAALKVEGWAAVQRYRLNDVQHRWPADTSPFSRLAIYELAGDPDQAVRNLLAAREKDLVPTTEATQNALAYLWLPSGPRHTREHPDGEAD